MLFIEEIPIDYQNGTLLTSTNNSSVISRVPPTPKPFSVVSLITGIKQDAVQLSQGVPLTSSATGIPLGASATGSKFFAQIRDSTTKILNLDKSKSEFNNSGIVQKKAIEPEPQKTDWMPYYIGGGIATFLVIILIIVSIARR